MDLPPVKIEILRFLGINEKPLRATIIAKELGKEGKEAKAVQTHLFGLVRSGLVETPEKGYYVISPKGKETLELREVTKDRALEILAQRTRDKAFHFYAELGKPTHIYAYDLLDFCNKIRTVELKTVVFHMERGDFEAWFKMLGDFELVKQIATLKSRNLLGEELRNALISVLKNRCITLSKIVGQPVPSK